jgi:hypothetical protein
MLSEAKHLDPSGEILRYAQDDTPLPPRSGIPILIVLLTWMLAGYIVFRESILKFWWDRNFLDWTINPLVRPDADRWLMPIVLLGRYASLLVFPWKLSPDYGARAIGWTAHASDPYLWIGVAAIGIWIIWFIIALRRRNAVATFALLAWLYSTRFGLALNAIRDDEAKAEAMGLHTRRYKTVAWSIAAFFLGIAGAVFGNMTGFIEPLEVAFPVTTFGIFMVLMALLGGKGTLWGPVIGAVLFDVVKELTWTYLLGWQWVTLGALIIVNIIFFPQGILGWVMERWPERFGRVVERKRAFFGKAAAT